MVEVGMYVAKTHFPKLIERVRKGETITITKHGVPVAVLAPPTQPGRLRPDEAIDALREFSRQLKARGVRVTREEITQWKHEGHKY